MHKRQESFSDTLEGISPNLLSSKEDSLALIDSHCHLHDCEFFTIEQAAECLKRAHLAGIEKVVCIGTSHEDSLAACEFASSHENVYWTYGIHPENANSSWELGDAYFEHTQGRSPKLTVLNENFPSLHDDGRLVAIGEVGLDYHYEGYNREAQIHLFEQMLQLASDNHLPVSFHVREAFADFFPVIANFPNILGVVHSFTDSKRVLKRILVETDFYIGVNGLTTYSTLPLPPLERIMLETDAPFLAPVPHRGETNEPAYVVEIAKWLSFKLDIPSADVAKITTNNTKALFKLTD